MQTEPHPEWYCVRTQVKREQIAAQHLRRLEGIEVFCPRLRYRKSTARGRIWWVEPLFPGYVMARFELEGMKRMVTHCTGVSGLVHFGAVVPSIPDKLVAELKHQVANHGDLETVTSTPLIEIGDEVRVGEGPLRGMSGHVVEVLSAKERAKVLLEFLGESRALELDFLSLILPNRPVSWSATPALPLPTGH